MDEDISFWPLVGYFGASLNLVAGIGLIVYAITIYSAEEVNLVSWYLIAAGASATLVIAPMVGCLSKIAAIMVTNHRHAVAVSELKREIEEERRAASV